MPKFTLIIGGSFGAGNYGMCGRAYGPRFLLTWPNARISRDGRRAGGERAGARSSATALEARGEAWPADEEEAFKAPIRAAIRQPRARPITPPRGCGTTASSRPRETRRVLGLAFSACLNAPIEPTRFGVFRM